MIAKWWGKIPAEEQKLIFGAIAAVLGSGALHFIGHNGQIATFDTTVAIVALLRWATDRLGAVVTTPTGTPPTFSVAPTSTSAGLVSLTIVDGGQKPPDTPDAVPTA